MMELLPKDIVIFNATLYCFWLIDFFLVKKQWTVVPVDIPIKKKSSGGGGRRSGPLKEYKERYNTKEEERNRLLFNLVFRFVINLW